MHLAKRTKEAELCFFFNFFSNEGHLPPDRRGIDQVLFFGRCLARRRLRGVVLLLDLQVVSSLLSVLPFTICPDAFHSILTPCPLIRRVLELLMRVRVRVTHPIHPLLTHTQPIRFPPAGSSSRRGGSKSFRWPKMMSWTCSTALCGRWIIFSDLIHELELI